MSFKQLSKPLNPSFKINSSLLKHNENKTCASLISIRKYSMSNKQIDEELNKPVKFTTSSASDWKAQYSRVGSKAEFGPWYEPHIVSVSLIGFMVYFFILREENDIDKMLEIPLSETLKKN